VSRLQVSDAEVPVGIGYILSIPVILHAMQNHLSLGHPLPVRAPGDSLDYAASIVCRIQLQPESGNRDRERVAYPFEHNSDPFRLKLFETLIYRIVVRSPVGS
jgi:hypothetical protein